MVLYEIHDSLYNNCNTGSQPSEQDITIDYSTIQESNYIDKGNNVLTDPEGRVTKPDVTHLCEWYLKGSDGGQLLNPTNAAERASKVLMDTTMFKDTKTHVALLAGIGQFITWEILLTSSGRENKTARVQPC